MYLLSHVMSATLEPRPGRLVEAARDVQLDGALRVPGGRGDLVLQEAHVHLVDHDEPAQLDRVRADAVDVGLDAVAERARLLKPRGNPGLGSQRGEVRDALAGDEVGEGLLQLPLARVLAVPDARLHLGLAAHRLALLRQLLVLLRAGL